MATKEVLQTGRNVKIDSRGNKTYGPMPSDDSEDVRPKSSALGSGAAANAAQAIIDARARRDAEAGYKRGGKVVAKKTQPRKPMAKSKPAAKSKSRR